MYHLKNFLKLDKLVFPKLLILASLISVLTLTGATGASLPDDVPSQSSVKVDISPEIRSKFERDPGIFSVQSQEHVEVLVSLEKRPRTSSVSEMKSRASVSQQGISKLARKSPQIELKNSFWITNAVLLQVDSNYPIENIARVEGVRRLNKNYNLKTLQSEPKLVSASDVSSQSSNSSTYGLEQINATRTWNEFGVKGEGIKVAVLDTGVDPEHPDIDLYTTNSSNSTYPGGWAEFYDNGTKINGSEPFDSGVHGTHVSGTVSGTDSSGKYIGVAPNVSLLHGLVLPNGTGSFAQIAGGVEWAVQNDAEIISMSLGTRCDPSPTYRDSYIDIVRNAENNGSLIVAATGNEGEGCSGSPGNVYDSLSVGASNRTEGIADFSSGEKVNTSTAWGTNAPEDWPSDYIVPDLAAPGVNIISSAPTPYCDTIFCYANLSGTSMATPHVSGAAALLESATSTELNPSQLKESFFETSRKPSYWNKSNASASLGQNDTRYGRGIIDVYAATEYAVNYFDGPQLAINTPRNKSYRKIPDFNITGEIPLEDAKFSIDGSQNYSMVKKNSTYYYNTSVTDLNEGRHNIVFWANNSKENWGSENISFTLDTQKPNLTVENPSEGDNISESFDINASWDDSTTSVVSHRYTIFNSTEVANSSLNTTFDSSNLQDGVYNISFNVSDEAGNYDNKTIEVTIDNTKPSISSFSPLDNSNISSNFGINGSAVDSLTGLNQSFYKLRNGSIQNSGELNASLNSRNYSDGKYNLTYFFIDYAGNEANKTVQLTIDNQKPSLNFLKPDNKSYISNNFSINASFSDTVTGVKNATYNLSNTSQLYVGDLNTTIDTSNLSESEYNITVKAEDYAGNIESKRINFTFDKTKPSINVSSPVPNANLSSMFYINATTSDQLSGIKHSTYTLFNSTKTTEASLNESLNSSQYADGEYKLNYTVYDKANNSETLSRDIQFDNTPPRIASTTVIDNENVSGLFDVNVSLNEATRVSNSEVRLSNKSKSSTEWKTLNATFNSTKYTEGDYNITFNLSDTLANKQVFNYSLTVDNTDPNLTLKDYDRTAQYKDWNNNSKTVEASCTDSRTGFAETKVSQLSTNKSPHNFTLTSTGEKNYNFTCFDKAGNQHTKNKTYKIDGRTPSITSVNPSNNTKTSRSYDLTAEFIDESNQSGINTSASSVTSTKGSIDTSYTNSSFTTSISDLSYSESYKISALLVDNLGHSYKETYLYSVKSEPVESEAGSSSGGGGGGGSGLSLPATDSENKSEPVTQNQSKKNNTLDQTASNQTNQDTSSTEYIDAVNPEETKCERFKQSETPIDWQNVEDCGQWERQTAEKVLEDISTTAEEERLAQAQAEFEKGNYTGVINLGSNLRKQEEQNITHGQYLKVAVVVLAIILFILTFFVVLRAKLFRDLKKISTQAIIDKKMGKEISNDRINKVEKSEKHLKNNRVIKAWKEIRRLKKS